MSNDAPAPAPEKKDVLAGFKEFLMRGNVAQLAVAVVVGAAFSKIVDAVVNGFINPLVGAIGTKDLDKYRFCLKKPCETSPTGEMTTGVALHWGPVLSATLTFVITAAVVYSLMILPMNKFKERQQAKADPVEVPKTEVELPWRSATRCSHSARARMAPPAPRTALGRPVRTARWGRSAVVASARTIDATVRRRSAALPSGQRKRRLPRWRQQLFHERLERTEREADSPELCADVVRGVGPGSEVVGRLLVEEAVEVGVRSPGCARLPPRPSPGRCRRRTGGSAGRRRPARLPRHAACPAGVRTAVRRSWPKRTARASACWY